ncbi:UPF0481-like protein [Cinnamomum micranthum f. kanehirae]|uniref:UPF0481-like protein n=1 Tax=Cinnamomum micranthum f. kanehirae TaxID=337451 RepID=A0A443PQD1_9MAGN|nr:UPF0481-like protein [Cinnamomum micranthum f. kanehirae]
MAEVTCGADKVSVDIEILQGCVSHPNPVSSPTSSEHGHGDEAHISFPIWEDDEEEPHSSTCEDDRGDEAHISFPIDEHDEEEPHSSTCEDDRGDEVHISLAISKDDEEEPYSSTSEDEGEEDHIPYSTSDDDGEESQIPFPQDDEKKAHSDWVSSIKQRSLLMPRMLKASSARVSCSIHRVPYGLRRHNQNAYDPQLISIGPFHHEKRKGQLLAMEEHKWRYLHDILSEKPKGWLESCLATIKGLEKRARSHYSEIIQRAKVAMDRVQHRDTRVEKLEAEKKKVTDALEGVCKNLKEEEEKNFSLVKDLEAAVNEVCKVKEECVALKAAAEVKAKRAIQLEAELEEARAELKRKDAELKRRSAELEVVCTEKAHVEATTQAEVDAAFNDRVGEATKDYERQLEALGPRLFELGCKAVLKKMAVSEDDPIYRDLPKLEPQASEESSVPPQAPAVAPALEAPVADAAPEVPPETPEK